MDLVKNVIVQNQIESKKSNAKKILKRASLPFYWEQDKNKMNTGFVLFKFGRMAKLKSNNWIDQKPPIFDLKGQPTSAVVTAGTLAKVAFQMVTFNTAVIGFGVLFRLCAVQIIEPAPKKTLSAADYGF